MVFLLQYNNTFKLVPEKLEREAKNVKDRAQYRTPIRKSIGVIFF